jgi:hypothetical protein
MVGRALADMMVGTGSNEATGAHGVRQHRIVSMQDGGRATTKKHGPERGHGNHKFRKLSCRQYQYWKTYRDLWYTSANQSNTASK